MTEKYRPPYSITPAILRLVGEIGEWIGRYTAADTGFAPQLRRGNRNTYHPGIAGYREQYSYIGTSHSGSRW